MTSRTRRLRSAAAVTGLMIALTGCGVASTGRSIPSVTGAAPAPTGSAGALSTPAATESNPPGDIPDNQAFVSYNPVTGGFSFKVPEGWARTGTGSTVVFTDKLNSVRVQEMSSSSSPTVASASAVDVLALKASAPKFLLQAVKTFKRSASTGILITYFADSAPDPVTNKVVRDAVERYSFWKGGRLVVVSLIGPKGADNVDPWRKVTDSFVWTG
jgi:hypothetical protein